MNIDAFIKPPKRIPIFIKLGLLISKKVTGKDLLVPKLLAWYPKAAFSSAVLELMIANGKKDLNERILKLVRIQCSFNVSCPFCIDMNSFQYEKLGISEEEMKGLTGKIDINSISTLTNKERLAIEYARQITETPVKITEEFIEVLKSEFTEREILILSSTAAQVNYWARMIKALGVPAAGFSNKCEIREET